MRPVLATLLVICFSVFCSNAAPLAPSGLVVTAPLFGEFNLTWADNATDEFSYRIDFRVPPSEDWISITGYPSDSTSAFLTGGNPATTYEFRVVAEGVILDDDSVSEVVAVTTPDRFTNVEFSNDAPYVHISIDEPFSYTPVANNAAGSTDVTYSAAPLPAGLMIDSETGEISGQTTEDGYFDVLIEAHYTNPIGPAARDRIDFRIAPAQSSPILQTPLGTSPLIALSPATNITLASHFVDPDTSLAVQIDTNHGNMVFSLFDRAMAEPVANFLNYVDRGDYSESVFHRSVNEATFDIIQAGGFVGDATGVTSIPSDPSIVNAPGIPNDRGTLAYARTPDPNSATSGWYINAQDSPGLDVGDSYAVFGRATAASLVAIDAIFAFPTGTHSIDINGGPSSLAGFPTTDGNAPNADPNNLIIVSQIVRVPALSYAIDSNSDPTVATVTLVNEGAELEITPLAEGITEVGLRVTDIDGNTTTVVHTVTVHGTYTIWIAGEAIAPKPEGLTDNPGGGSFNNLQSYAFGGDADDASDDSAREPQATTVEVEGELYGALCFYHRKYSSDLQYTIESTTDLSSWSTVWTSAAGNDDGTVVTVTDDGDYWKITVRRDVATSSDGTALFRVRVSHP